MNSFPSRSRIRLYLALLIVGVCSVGGLVPAHADAPSNDDLASAQVIPTDSFSVTGTDVGATQEAFEQTLDYMSLTFGFDLDASVWYSWTPSVSGVVHIAGASLGGNDNNTPVLLFKGPGTPTSTTFVASASPGSSSYNANVTADQPYFLSVAIEKINAHSFTVVGKLTAQSTPTPTPTPSSEPSVNLVVKATKVSRSSGATGKVLVELSSAATTDLTITYKTGGTAVNGTDYKMLLGSVPVPAGATKATLKIKPLPGSTDTLSVKLTVTAGTGYTVGSSAKGKIKIVD